LNIVPPPCADFVMSLNQHIVLQFEKPGRREDFDYPDMAKEAGTKALADAGISYNKIEQAVVGYCYGDTTCGQRALYQLGLTGIPMYNVSVLYVF